MDKEIKQMMQWRLNSDPETAQFQEWTTISPRCSALFREIGLTNVLPHDPHIPWRIGFHFPCRPGRLTLFKSGEYSPIRGGDCYVGYMDSARPMVKTIGNPTAINSEALRILTKLVYYGRDVIEGFSAGSEYVDMDSRELAAALLGYFFSSATEG